MLRKNCGIAGRIVAWRWMISCKTFRGGCSDRINTMDPPTNNGRNTPTHSMKLWNIGSNTAIRSSCTHCNTSRQLSTLCSRLPCDSIAPFGRPVVPEV